MEVFVLFIAALVVCAVFDGNNRVRGGSVVKTPPPRIPK